MNLSSEVPGAIDAALDQFEDQWLSDDSPPDVVAVVESLRPWAGFAVRRVAWELAMSDLELRWRHPDTTLRRGTRWYAEQLGPLGLDLADLEELSSHELIVRSRWADRPNLEQLLDDQFPGLYGKSRPRHHRRLIEQLEAHFPLQCVIKIDGGSRFWSEVPTPCVFGRQRADDPDPGKPHLDPVAGQWRIIVAERHQNRISRHQAMIRRVAVHQISIESLSANVGCYIGHHRLPLEQPVVIEINSPPLELRFQNVAVRFFPG